MDKRTSDELARYASGQPGEVQSQGDHGYLDGRLVRKSGGDVISGSDRVSVSHGMVFVNGQYRGPAPS